MLQGKREHSEYCGTSPPLYVSPLDEPKVNRSYECLADHDGIVRPESADDPTDRSLEFCRNRQNPSPAEYCDYSETKPGPTEPLSQTNCLQSKDRPCEHNREGWCCENQLISDAIFSRLVCKYRKSSAKADS